MSPFSFHFISWGSFLWGFIWGLPSIDVLQTTVLLPILFVLSFFFIDIFFFETITDYSCFLLRSSLACTFVSELVVYDNGLRIVKVYKKGSVLNLKNLNPVLPSSAATLHLCLYFLSALCSQLYILPLHPSWWFLLIWPFAACVIGLVSTASSCRVNYFCQEFTVFSPSSTGFFHYFTAALFLWYTCLTLPFEGLWLQPYRLALLCSKFVAFRSYWYSFRHYFHLLVPSWSRNWSCVNRQAEEFNHLSATFIFY